MVKKLLIFNLLLFYLFVLCFGSDDEICSKASNCKKCMEKSPNCAWCFDAKYNDKNIGPGYRCATKKTLLIRECPENSIEFIRSSFESKSTLRVKRQTADDETQLKPLTQSVAIRPGVPLDINLGYHAIGNYPVDLYYLTDMSYSMTDDLKTVSSMTKTIFKELGKLTKKLRMGFGGFVDKPIFPFVNPSPAALKNPCINLENSQNQKCDPPFLYKHILELTSNFTMFQEKTRQTTPSGNLDSPEGGLDALLQVAYCDNYIKWDSNARKIVLFTSDGGFHVAGDGRLAGLIKPPPRQCQLNNQSDRFNPHLHYLGWHDSIETDYPSVGEVASVLKDKGINIIFATNQENKLLYEKLSEFLPSAAVGVIEESSTNIVELLKENYRKILSKVSISPKFDDNLLDVKILTKCDGEKEFTEKSVCNENPVDGKIEYRMVVNTKKCFSDESVLILQIGGLKDNATVRVKAACDCTRCENTTKETNSPHCKGRGTFYCGTCQCNSGFSGDFCECSAADQSQVNEKDCMKEGDTEVCSGRGRCECGVCKCSLPRYQKKYCECDVLACPRAIIDNKVCGGHQRGTCECNGKCKCKEGYRGEACDCLANNKKCIDPQNTTAPLCYNNGQCDCGYCFCDAGFSGEFCKHRADSKKRRCSTSNQGDDKEFMSCMLCLYKELVKDNKPQVPVSDAGIAQLNVTSCNDKCSSINVDMTKLRLEEKYYEESGDVCIAYDENGCRIYVLHKLSDEIYTDRKTLLSFQIKKECADKTNLIIIIVSVIIGIVIIGVILLLIWKLVVTIDDRRENAIYQEQLMNAKWETEENPIFKPPVTTVKNPLYAGDDTN